MTVFPKLTCFFYFLIFQHSGVANALDLTDRILPRLQAKPHCRPQLLHFPPYSRQELSAIVQDRLAQVSHRSRARAPPGVSEPVFVFLPAKSNDRTIAHHCVTFSPRTLSGVRRRCSRCCCRSVLCQEGVCGFRRCPKSIRHLQVWELWLKLFNSHFYLFIFNI